MQTMLETISLPNVVRIGPWLAKRFDITRQALLLSLMKSKAQLPMNDLTARSLGWLFSAAWGSERLLQNTDVPAAHTVKLADSCEALAEGFLNFAGVVEDLALSQRIRLTQALVQKEKLAQLILNNAGLGTSPLITEQMMVDIIMRGHSAGPPGSELDVARLVSRWLSVEEPLWVNDPKKASSDTDLIHNLTYLRALETWHKYMSTPSVSSTIEVLQMSPEQAATSLARLLRTIAITMVGVPHAAAIAVLKHLFAVAEHPWIRQGLEARTLIEIDQFITHAKARVSFASAWPDYPELESSSLWDLSLLDPLSGITKTADIPARLLDISAANELILYSELRSGVAIETTFGTKLLGRIKTMIELIVRMETLQSAARLETGDAVQYGGITVSSISVPDAASLRRPQVVADVTGYPCVSRREVITPGPRDSVSAVRHLDMDRMKHYTTASVGSMVNVFQGSYQAVVIGGHPEESLSVPQPTLVPVIPGVNDNIIVAAPTLDVLTRMWDTSPLTFKRTVSSLPADPTNPLLRAYADKLRFVGVLYLDERALNGQIRIVLPTRQHWYHASSKALGVELSAYAEIHAGTKASADPAPTTDENGPVAFSVFDPSWVVLELGPIRAEGAVLRFAPFARIPSSAIMPRSGTKLKEMPFYRTPESAALLRWIDDVKPTGLWSILGWTTTGSDNVADIVAVPTDFASEMYYELQGKSDVRPQYISRVNGVNSVIAESATTVWNPPQVDGVVDADQPIV